MSKRLSPSEEVLDASASKRIHLTNGDESSSQANGGAAPILHSVPKSILPILHQPYQLSDFFTDVDNDINDPKINKQVSSIVKYFPPPAPNFLSPDFSAYQNGLMIPFIYPPPPAQKDAHDDLKVIPPLPFPPPNYMPYPLVSENSSLNPKDVFKSFLDALAKLPRIDMVVASAAGSLYDMKAQAGEEGFTISEHEEEKEKLRLEKIKREDQLLTEQEKREQADDFDENDDNEEDGDEDDHLVYDDEYEEYKEFASNVDITDVYDKNDKSAERNVFEFRKPTQPGFGEINSNISNIKKKKNKKDNNLKINLHKYNEFSASRQSSESEKPLKLPISSNKLTTSTSPSQQTASSGKDKDKRNAYFKNLNDIQEFEKLNETEIYIALKKAQLERLKRLNESKILFNGKEEIHDEELNDIKIALEESRDIDLVGMKLLENYELLNNALVFYQDSNKSYKHMNSIMINKLMKLKNFFEYQRDMFKNQLLEENSSNLFDIKTKDSGKLFAGISQKDIATFLREEMKKEQSVDGNTKSDVGLSQYNKFTPTSILLVHDFMPLINLNEFNLITGELPNHKYKAQQQDQTHLKGPAGTSNIKHQIFKSSLYDPMTSGSDTNGGGSDVSNIAAPKRRGRRAANSSLNGTGSGAGSAGGNNTAANGGSGAGNSGAPGGSSPGDKFIDSSDKGNSKYSETLLLARIMKHYIPPQGARQDELVNDLESMGVQTKWPV